MTRSVPLLVSAGLTILVACGGGQPQTASSPMTPAETTRTDPSTAASTVSADDISRRPGESVENILAGKVAGVLVGRNTDGTITVRMRNTTSFLGNEEPLIILDGMAFTPGSNGALTGINPSDIESIRALKDAADLAFYGSRGANGVIVIKTKKPKKP